MNIKIALSYFPIGAVLVTTLLAMPQEAQAQSRESGPWWPNAEWGSADQTGASNRITGETILESLELVTTGKVYELGQVYEAGMPVFPGRIYSMITAQKGSPFGANKLVGNDEIFSAQIGQVGTQFDGLGHIGQAVEMKNGETKYVFYNGVTANEMDSSGGLMKLGVEHVKPIITRGILIDIASYKGVPRLPRSYEVTVEDVLGALDKQGISEKGIKPGDALLFRYGWSELWTQPDEYNLNPPGIGLDVAQWVVERKATMVGSDSWTTEVVPSPEPGFAFPVHQELMMKNGIYNLENMQFDELVADGVNEFLFVLTPLRLKGASGSPARPIAIR